MGRKTIEVGKILNIANHFLAAKNTKEDEREAVCAMLETILHETGNYMGYRYLTIEGTTYVSDSSRRYYFPSATVRDDFEAELRDINKIRV
jgi:hypothetical protein